MENAVNGEKTFSAYTPIEQVHDWYLVTSVPTDVIAENGNIVMKIFYMVMVSLVLIFLVSICYFAWNKRRQKRVLEKNCFWKCQCRRISVNGINVEAIMADYFGQKLPFEAKKPEEFKDAIAVASIIQEMDNLSEEELYVVISNDTGFREAVKEKAKEPKN